MTVPLALTVTFGLGAAVGALAILIVLEWQHRRRIARYNRAWRGRINKLFVAPGDYDPRN